MAFSDNLSELLVDGAPWRRLDGPDQLKRAAATDRVFVLDAEAGVVTFGDGVHGQRPPAGAVISGRYRDGAGRSGNVEGRWTGTLTAVLQPVPRRRWPLVLLLLVLLGLGWTIWRALS